MSGSPTGHSQTGSGGSGTMPVDALSPTAASGGITPRRIIKTIQPPPARGTELVQLDSSSGLRRRLSTLANSLPSDASLSEVRSEMPSCAGDEQGDVSMSSFFDQQRLRTARTIQPRNKSHSRNRRSNSNNNNNNNGNVRARRNSTNKANLEQSILSYSSANSFYSHDSLSFSGTHSSASSGYDSGDSSCTAISESVPSCSLTVLCEMSNSRFPQGGSAVAVASRLRKAQAVRHNSSSFGSIFGAAGIDPYNGTSINSYPSRTNQSSPLRGQFTASEIAASRRMHERFNGSQQSHEEEVADCSKSRRQLSTSNRATLACSSSVSAAAVSGSIAEAADLGDKVNGAAAAATGGSMSPALSGSSSGRKAVTIADTAPTLMEVDGGAGDENDAVGDLSDVQWRVQHAEKLERVGRGSYGDVYKGIDAETGKTIAIKEIMVPKDFSKDLEKQLQALEREISVMRKLHHVNTVNYLGATREENCLNIFMEFISGGSIGEHLRASGPFTEEMTCKYTAQLLCGLEYLHDKHIVHRDLKGDNLFLTDDDVLKLGDFGTSKELATTLVTDSVAGTPNFMAPEVIACSGHSYAADIWSVGCCVLEMLTGAPPFAKHDNAMAVMFAVMRGRLEEQVPAHISEGAKDFIKSCTRTDPKDRWSISQLQSHPWLLASPSGRKKKRKKRESEEVANGGDSGPKSTAARRRSSIIEAFKSQADLSEPRNSPPLKGMGHSQPKRQAGSARSKTSTLDVSALAKTATDPPTASLSPAALSTTTRTTPTAASGSAAVGGSGSIEDHSTDTFGYDNFPTEHGVSSSNPSSHEESPQSRKTALKKGSTNTPQHAPHAPSRPSSPPAVGPRRPTRGGGRVVLAGGLKKDRQSSSSSRARQSSILSVNPSQQPRGVSFGQRKSARSLSGESGQQRQSSGLAGAARAMRQGNVGEAKPPNGPPSSNPRRPTGTSPKSFKRKNGEATKTER